MSNKICIVTGKKYQDGAIILDSRMKPSLEKDTVTGYGISPEIEQKINSGYIVLVEVDMSKSGVSLTDTINPENAYRTGSVMYVKKNRFGLFFNVDPPEGKIAYVPKEVIDLIKEKTGYVQDK